MRCLIAGTTGMLGRRLRRDALSRGWDIFSVARRDADFIVDLEDSGRLLDLRKKTNADVIINCAALTDIDECERNIEKARQINSVAPLNLAKLAEAWNAYYIHVSTDHFFHGDERLKHKENHPVTLVNNYAITKLEGENHALEYKNAMVARTNIVGFRSTTPKNTFLEWALKQLMSGKETIGFHDFYTSGMPVGKLSEVLIELSEKNRPTGKWNVTGIDVFSKEEMIRQLAKTFKLSEKNIVPGSVKDFKGTPRANSLGLDSSRIENLLGYKLPGLVESMERLKSEYLASEEIQKFIGPKL